MKRWSLRLRLILLFSLLALLTWLVAGSVAWYQARNGINELFDTQQMLFAKRLATAEIAGAATQRLPKTKKLLRHGSDGQQDDDALAFAIFSSAGQMLLNDGKNGANFRFQDRREGFSNVQIRERDGDREPWRMLWLTSEDGRYHVAVGQELDYRHDMIFSLVTAQLLPWLITLPILMLCIALVVGQALRPLRQIASQLSARAPDDERPLTAASVPAEVRPLVTALNALLERVSAMLLRERRFTSDAAHELRSPLTALRVQTEVAQLAGDDLPMRAHALANLSEGIDRASRLIDQLLTLSRLESLAQLDDIRQVTWLEIVQAQVAELYFSAEKKRVRLQLEVQAPQATIRGQPLLLSLLVRNLLDNAIRYTPAGGRVSIALDERALRVEDSGPGVSDEHLARLGERFYRPPGQEQNGSGLGVSIVQRIAQLHGLEVCFANRPGGGFTVRIGFAGR